MRGRLTAVFALMIAFLIYALWGVDMKEVAEALVKANWINFIAVFFCYLLSHCLRTVRLSTILEYQGSFTSMFSINSIGFLAINIIPLRLGEMIRPYLLKEQSGIPFSQSVAIGLPVSSKLSQYSIHTPCFVSLGTSKRKAA